MLYLQLLDLLVHPELPLVREAPDVPFTPEVPIVPEEPDEPEVLLNAD